MGRKRRRKTEEWRGVKGKGGEEKEKEEKFCSPLSELEESTPKHGEVKTGSKYQPWTKRGRNTCLLDWSAFLLSIVFTCWTRFHFLTQEQCGPRES